jgi:hypothetical protein
MSALNETNATRTCHRVKLQAELWFERGARTTGWLVFRNQEPVYTEPY